ncbi:MAG: 6-bladed beta-propeller [Clostridiales bacterium]|jgi:DNA-binding beta-propeller fold protein YncE|nr:6-bladed beta-propeller [Clostridiales bacterium]
MSEFAGRLGRTFSDFDREKLRRAQIGLTIALVILFLILYLMNRDPLRLTQQFLPGTSMPQFLYSIYGPNADEMMAKPMAVTVSGNRVYVADTGNSRVQVYDYNGNHLLSFGSNGRSPGQFRFPYGVATDSDGRILVADMYNNNVSVFTPNGDFLHYFGTSLDFGSPAGLFADDGRIYVADVGLHKISVFDESGEKILEFGSEGTEPGQFRSPNAVTVSRQYVIVSDTGNDRIQFFNKLGTYIGHISGVSKNKQFINPRGLAMDPQGVIYLVNNLTHELLAMNEQGELQYVVGGMGQGPGQFYLPNGLFIDNQGRIYVTDTSNRRVNVYR